MWPYASEAEAVSDVLRLSRGMTYKAALAGLPLGGGKAVVIGDPGRDKSPALLQALGRAVEALGGRYVTAEDVGTTPADMAEIRRATRHVAGLAVDRGGSGDPSPATAAGVLAGMRAALAHAGRGPGLAGVKVAVQGLGHVGQHLCRLLAEAGARLVVTDIAEGRIADAVHRYGAEAVEPGAIVEAEADVFAPCAIGAVISDATLPRLAAGIIAGSANNQLAESRHGAALAQRGILFAPDYVVNAGGLISVAAGRLGLGADAVARRIEAIGETTGDILRLADRMGIPTNLAADRIAEERFRSHRPEGLAA
jgi:leucine dehydrogenase